MAAIGLSLVTLLTVVFVFFDSSTNLWLIRVVLFFRGFSMAFSMIAIQAAVFTNISVKDTGRASSIFNTNRQVASSFGVAVLGAVLFELLLSRSNAVTNQLNAYHIAFIVAGVMGLIAALIGLTIHDKDAEASMKKQAKPQAISE